MEARRWRWAGLASVGRAPAGRGREGVSSATTACRGGGDGPRARLPFSDVAVPAPPPPCPFRGGSASSVLPARLGLPPGRPLAAPSAAAAAARPPAPPGPPSLPRPAFRLPAPVVPRSPRRPARGCPRRVSGRVRRGGGALRGVVVVLLLRGGERRLARGRPPPGARLPPPALDGPPVRRASAPSPPSRSSPLPLPPRPTPRLWGLGARVRLSPSPSPPPPPPSPGPARSRPASRCGPPPPPSVARRGPGRGCGEGRGSAGRVFSPKARRGGGSRGCSSEARGSGRPRPRWLLGAGERPGREREAGCRAVAGPASRRPPGPGPSRAGSVGGLAPLAWRCRPRPAGGEDRRRGGGGGGGLWPRSPAPRLARPPPPSVQVPSASRRGGLKTLWGSPVRLGSGRSGPRGGSVPSSRLRRLGPRHPVGCAGGVATPRARSTRPPGGGSPPARWPSCRVRVRVRPPPPPRPRCGVGRGRWEPPGRLWGCPRSPPAPARARRGRRPDAPSFVRPFRPCRSLISWSLLAGQRRPPGMCRAREGGSPLRSKLVRLLAVDHSARASMKNAASCEN